MKEETKLAIHEIKVMKKCNHDAESIVAFLQGWYSSEMKYPVEYTTEDIYEIMKVILEKRIADPEGQVQSQQLMTFVQEDSDGNKYCSGKSIKGY